MKTLLSVILNDAECTYSSRSLDFSSIIALSLIADFIDLTVLIVDTISYDRWLDTNLLQTLSPGQSFSQDTLRLLANRLVTP